MCKHRPIKSHFSFNQNGGGGGATRASLRFEKDWISRKIIENYRYLTCIFRTEVKPWGQHSMIIFTSDTMLHMICIPQETTFLSSPGSSRRIILLHAHTLFCLFQLSNKSPKPSKMVDNKRSLRGGVPEGWEGGLVEGTEVVITIRRVIFREFETRNSSLEL